MRSQPRRRNTVKQNLTKGFQPDGSYTPHYGPKRRNTFKKEPGRGLFMSLAEGWNDIITIIGIGIVLYFVYCLFA